MTFLKLPNPNGGDWQSGYEKNGESYNYASSDDAYENGCYGYTSGKYGPYDLDLKKGVDFGLKNSVYLDLNSFTVSNFDLKPKLCQQCT